MQISRKEVARCIKLFRRAISGRTSRVIDGLAKWQGRSGHSGRRASSRDTVCGWLLVLRRLLSIGHDADRGWLGRIPGQGGLGHVQSGFLESSEEGEPSCIKRLHPTQCCVWKCISWCLLLLFEILRFLSSKRVCSSTSYLDPYGRIDYTVRPKYEIPVSNMAR